MRDAILLVNMGGPARRNDVRPYLREIFSDPAILALPGFVRKPLASLIAIRRADDVAERYESIGGYSPLFHWSEQLKREVKRGLELEQDETEVAFAFRYISPTIRETMAQLAHKGMSRVHVLPLFPHYTHTMTGSVMMQVGSAARSLGIEFDYVEDWGQAECMIKIWNGYLQDALREAGEGARVIFVAHGIPQLYVKRGDDYPDRVRSTAEKLARNLPDTTEWSVAFQSKVGPVEWTRPYMEVVLSEWCKRDAPIVMMPLSFAADCLETLYDLDIVAKHIAESNRVKKYARVRVFNDDPEFARGLLSLCREKEHAAC